MPQLIDNIGTITFADQKNTITLETEKTFIDTDIILTTKVTKALLNKTSSDTDHKTFNIQIPNGDATDLILTFTTDTSGNTIVTGINAT